ncbi:MAG: prephenate dehydrogenase/arogenate dehydrogenase family protein [Xanthomonadales bacterium]|nr:prephenate dehydrogenase/arogenate dehydrogenase family protein [Xanthomonadales bacterium]
MSEHTPSQSSPDLDRLRARLDEVDALLIRTIAERQAIVAEIGKVKHAAGGQLRDFRRERQVLDKVRRAASEAGLAEDLAEEVMRRLIGSSLTTQEQDRVRWSGTGQGRRALVIGGSGKMGGWMARFLADQGFAVEVADPKRPSDPHLPWHADWRESALDQDLIVISAPLGASAKLLEQLTERRPQGLIFDVGSLKTPLAGALRGAAAAGLRICSVHPMFGPDTVLLSGRHVIFVDLGNPAAVAQARELFSATSADLVDMDLDEHDQLIAYVLGLSHAVNIAFFAALTDSGAAAPRLAQLSSTTFDRQLAVASQVANENPRLYFEIQKLNAHGCQALEGLERAVAELIRAVRAGDEVAFVSMMERGRGYLSARPPSRGAP